MDKKRFLPHKLSRVSKKVYDKRKKDVEFYHYTSIEFIALIDKQSQKIEALENEIAILKNEKEPAVVLTKYELSDYNQEWSYSTKICFILRCANKPMDSLEIYMRLLDMDEKFIVLKRMQTSLSKILNEMSKSKRIIRIKRPGIKKLLFLLPNWVGKNGEPLPYYHPFIDDEFCNPLVNI
jgi:hypothetical protein